MRCKANPQTAVTAASATTTASGRVLVQGWADMNQIGGLDGDLCAVFQFDHQRFRQEVSRLHSPYPLGRLDRGPDLRQATLDLLVHRVLIAKAALQPPAHPRQLTRIEGEVLVFRHPD